MFPNTLTRLPSQSEDALTQKFRKWMKEEAEFEIENCLMEIIASKTSLPRPDEPKSEHSAGSRDRSSNESFDQQSGSQKRKGMDPLWNYSRI